MLNNRPTIRLPLGVRDFLPQAAARRRSIVERLLTMFETWGYSRLITPMFECADVLERGLDRDARAEAIRFVEPGTGEVVALRPDITPQVARIAATRMDEVDGPLRFCYEGAVTRFSGGARTQREILQAGVELIGAGAPEGDAEILSVAAAALATMDMVDVHLDIGHVAPARFALNAIADPGQRRAMADLLAKKARAGVARAAAGLEPPLREILEALPTLYGDPTNVLRQARTLAWPDKVHRALDEVENVLHLTRDVIETELHAPVTVDLGEMRGFEYYTGIRLAGYAQGAGDAVLYGGRYDELVGRYGRSAQATGFAADIEAMAEAQRIGGVTVPAAAESVLVATTEKRRREGMRVAASLRTQGVRAAVDLGGSRSRKALLTYADEVGFARVLVLDETGAQLFALGGAESQPHDVVAAAVTGPAVARAVAGDPKPLLDALPRRNQGPRHRPSRVWNQRKS